MKNKKEEIGEWKMKSILTKQNCNDEKFEKLEKKVCLESSTDSSDLQYINFGTY